MSVVYVQAYMRGYKVGDKVDTKTPPNGTKYVSRDLLHSSHQGNGVVDFWEVLEQKDEQKYCHYQLNLLFSDQLWQYQPKHKLHMTHKKPVEAVMKQIM